LLVLDIGNSTTHCGIWTKGAIRTHERIGHEQDALLLKRLAEFWDALGGDRATIVCSVAERHLQRLRPRLEALTRQPCLVVGREFAFPRRVAIDEPGTVGADRLCCAAAAYEIEGRACAVADFGTALTVDCVNDAGEFIGGAIMPGLGLQATALAQASERLPEVPILMPPDALGQNTASAIQAGIVLGSLGAVRELVERFAVKLGRWPTLFVTGGHAEIVAQGSDLFDRVVPDLCLRGAVLAYHSSFV
jgi:type III pantothenate kinase